MKMAKRLVIKATTLFDGKKRSHDKLIIIEADKIVDIIDAKEAKEEKIDFEGFVSPAFIDAHSHIGMCREGEPSSEDEVNDVTNQIMPLNDPLNSIYFDDHAFSDALDFGVLYSCVIPGSGNLVGGKAKIIKNFARTRRDALLKDYGYKMALGFNPRSTYPDWRGDRPNTRMGTYQLLEKRFDEVLAKKAKAEITRTKKLNEILQKSEKKELEPKEVDRDRFLTEREYALEFTQEDLALLEILSGKKVVKVHVHKEDDVYYLIDLVKKYKMNVTADHLGDVFSKEVFDDLARAGIKIVYGPLGSLGYKTELKHSFYQNVKELLKSKATFGLMTDHPVILSYSLRDSLKFFLTQGMSEDAALSLITLKNAQILGIDDVLGSVEVGKTASILVWNKDPLHLSAYPKIVLAEGNVIRKRS